MCTEILAWPVPDIDVKVNNPPVLLATTLPTRMALSFTGANWRARRCTSSEILDVAMAALPLDSLVTFTAQSLSWALNKQSWLRHLLRWPLLKRVHLGPCTAHGFWEMLLEDNGGCESPLLPLLTEFVLSNIQLSMSEILCLCDTLMKRVEQGVPLEKLDLCMCSGDGPPDAQLLSEIVVDLLGIKKNLRARKKMKKMWGSVDDVVDGLFCEDDIFSAEGDDSDTDRDDEDEDEAE
jgi:hypothetical protein